MGSKQWLIAVLILGGCGGTQDSNPVHPPADAGITVTHPDAHEAAVPDASVVLTDDLRNDPRYMPHQSGCTDEVDHSTAVDVADRPVGDFLWQRQPWNLYDPGNVNQTEPGVDYLVAYWMARAHGFLGDDTAGECLRWQ